jgi:hypothetical protein
MDIESKRKELLDIVKARPLVNVAVNHNDDTGETLVEGKEEYHASYAPKLHFFTKEELIPAQDIVSDGNLTKLNIT